MKTLLLMVMMLTGWAMSCCAQLTLEACQQMAKQNYPLIKRYDLIRRSAAYNVSNIKKAWLPQVQASAQATVQNRTTQLPDKLSSILAQSGQTYEGIGKGKSARRFGTAGESVDKQKWKSARKK